MRSFTTTIVLALATLLFASTCLAQQAATTAVPNLIRYGGTLTDANGAPITAATGVTFAIYKQQDGGAAVWMETQNVTPDANGQYSVLLGSTTATGLPSDLFSQEEQRWLSVQVQGQIEQPRVLMVSVPYAFKAHEAETLGGMSASDFVLANGANSSAAQPGVAGSGQAASSSGSLQPGQKGAGSPPPQDGPTNFSGSNTTQIVGVTQSGSGAGLSASAASNAVVGTATASSGIAGVFNSAAGGKILSGRSGGTEQFFVDGSGNVNAASSYQIGGSSVLGVARTSLFVGIGAGFHTTGSADVFCGYQAGFTTTTGSTNTFSGFKAGYSNTTGSSNSFYGSEAGFSGSTGSNNTFSGETAGYSNVGSNNTFSGVRAGYFNTSGSYNTLYGESAGLHNTTGSSDVYIANPGPASGTESNTIRIGDEGSGVGHQNAAYIAGIYGSTTSHGAPVFIDSTGQLGTAGGAVVTSFNGRTGAVLPATNDYSFSLIGGTVGATQLRGTYTDRLTLNNTDNSFTGNGAGLYGVLPAGDSPHYIQNGTAQQSSANFNISGSGVAGGKLSGNIVNTVQGYEISGNSVLSVGSASVFLGVGAGGHTTGNENTFSGFQAGDSNTTGADNTFSGYKAGYSNVSGSHNTFSGAGAGFSNTTGSSDVYIANPGPTSGTESNTIRIGNQGSGAGHQNAAYIAGIYGSTTTNGAPVFIDSTGKVGTGGGGLVSSFNGRTGAVLPAANDYSLSLISGTLGSAQLAGTYRTQVAFDNSNDSFSGKTVNTADGYRIAGTSVLSLGSASVFLGVGAGANNTGINNTFAGSHAGGANTTGQGNTFTGNQAGAANTSGGGNTFTGNYSGNGNTTGAGNSFYGQLAGLLNTTGSDNTYVGNQAGRSNSTGQQNTIIGDSAGFRSTTGSGNIFVGYEAGEQNTTGSSDVYVANPGPTSGTESNTIRIGNQGSGAGHQNAAYIAGIYGSTTTNGAPVFIDSTGKVGTGGGGLVSSFNGRTGTVLPAANDYSFSLISGTLGSAQLAGTYRTQVAFDNSNDYFSGKTVNTADGYRIAGNSVLNVGPGGLFVGVGAGANNTGINNTFAGSHAGGANTTGQGNTFTGNQAGAATTSGGGNTFTGNYSGNGNTTGAGNSFYGQLAGLLNTTGSDNTYVGANAGTANSTGQQNTIIGESAGSRSTTGSGNIFVGYQAGKQNTTGGSDVYIANLGPTSGTESNTIRIGTQGSGAGQQNATYIAGIFGSTSSSGVPVFVNSTGQLGTLTSSLRFKEQVQDMGDSTSALMKLRPVTFFYKPEYSQGERTLQYGLIAEEVAHVYPELVAYDDDGKPYTVRYQYIATMLLNEVQKQYHRAEAEATVIQSLQQEIQNLKQQLQLQNATLQERLSRLEKLVENQVQTVAQK